MRVVALVLMLTPSCLMGQTPLPERPGLLQELLGCTPIVEPAARLACYDRQVRALDLAQQNRDIVIADRAEIRRTRRSLFGLSLPDLGVFGGGDETSEEAGTIEAKIASAFQNRSGKWVILLEDGARWVQTDARSLSKGARKGQTIRIRRAAMGSFLANIDGQIAIRVRRENS